MLHIISRAITLMAAILCCLTSTAGIYSVESMPNVQLSDRTKHLVNPDGIISTAAQAQIDSLLLDARRQTSAEIVAVIVDDIDSNDIDVFATDLINKWGVGKSDKNNGILILVAKNSRQATIRTGYGAEGIMPDALAGRIIYDYMIPRFQNEDYEGGMLAGVKAVHDVVTDPAAREEIMSKQNDSYADDFDFGNVFKVYAIGSGVMLLIFLFIALGLRGKSDYEKYTGTAKAMKVFTVLSACLLGITALGLLVAWLIRTYWKRRARRCDNCGASMHRLDRGSSISFLTPAQNLENKLGSVKYDVWQCPNCGKTDTQGYEPMFSSYSKCPKCGAKTSKKVSEQILEHPTTYHSGSGERTYECLNCGALTTQQYTIPRRGGGGGFFIGGGGGGRGGRGPFGGGFGGGRSGGGGATGRW